MQFLLFASLLVLLLLLVDANRRPRESLMTGTPKSYPNTYCSASAGSIPLSEDVYSSFGVSRTECQAQCMDRPDCTHVSFGRWEKLGIHYGRMRCQLYQTCHFRERRGMTVHEKRRLRPLAAVRYVLQLTAVAAALLSRWCAGLCGAFSAALLLHGLADADAPHGSPHLLATAAQLWCTLLLLATHQRLRRRATEIRAAEAAKPARLRRLEERVFEAIDAEGESRHEARVWQTLIDLGVAAGAVAAALAYGQWLVTTLGGGDSVFADWNVANVVTTALAGVHFHGLLRALLGLGLAALLGGPVVAALRRFEAGLHRWTRDPRLDLEQQAAAVAAHAYHCERRVLRGLGALRPFLDQGATAAVPRALLGAKVREALPGVDAGADAADALMCAAARYFMAGPGDGDGGPALRQLQEHVEHRAVGAMRLRLRDLPRLTDAVLFSDDEFWEAVACGAQGAPRAAAEPAGRVLSGGWRAVWAFLRGGGPAVRAVRPQATDWIPETITRHGSVTCTTAAVSSGAATECPQAGAPKPSCGLQQRQVKR